MMAESVLAWSLPLDVDVVKIHFNHNTGSTSSDGITIQEDETTITAPEWMSSKNEESAYTVAVDDPTVKVEFYCSDTQDFSSVQIYSYRTSGSSTWALDTETITFNPSGSSGTVSFDTKSNGKQPTTVGEYSVSWSWRVLYVDASEQSPPIEIDTSSHTFYNVLSIPTAPMAVPWVEVLDYSCDWASGETTEVNVATEVAKTLYSDLGIDYQYSTRYTDGTDNEELWLQTFLDDVSDNNTLVSNCSDMANLFCTFSSALGCESQTKALYGSMHTRSIYVIGDSIPLEKDFGLHQFGWLNSKVYDSCLWLWNNGVIHPYNMSLLDYKGWLISTGSPSDLDPITTVITEKP